jgi:hypothetical protein
MNAHAARFPWGLGLLLLLPVPAAAATGAGKAIADVVVIVDTSVSMKEPGMDPERSSLLVAKLFSDIVPGDLAVLRALDLAADKQLLPSRDTGRIEPCLEDPSRSCHVVEAAADWMADARKGRFGALARPVRGDSAYKTRLDSHLAQVSNNSPFELAFAAAQGVFDEHGRRQTPRTVIWLSDGRPDHPEPVRQVIAQMAAQGTAVEAVVFGRGDVRIARDSGLEVRQAASPAQLMKAFAGIFRRIVQAPYRIDSEVAADPAFEMKANVQEAWVVVYGDDSLRQASLTGPRGTVAADYARDSFPGAGAYRVAYLERPVAGRWMVEAQGGGPGVAFAVVQRSSLRPVLLAPANAVAGARLQLVAGLSSEATGALVTDPGVLAGTRMSALVENRWIDLADDGADGDAARGDGRFSGWAKFQTVGDARVRVRAFNPLLDRTVEAVVKVSGGIKSTGARLTFWQLWGRYLLALLGALLALAVVLGFVLPKRFPPSLAVTFVPDRSELDEQTPQPVAQWTGVGIGFYRDARAFLHSNYRLSGKPGGALACLLAEGTGTRVGPGRGTSLSRETLDGGWEAVDAEGRRARGGDVYRVGDGGPFFRISSRTGRG